MKNVCISLAFVIMLVLPSTAMAQAEGAIVVRGQGNYDLAWVEWDGARALIVMSTYPDFFCGGGQSVPDWWQVVTTPTGAVHYVENPRLFARVYDGTPDDLWGPDGNTNPFIFICGQKPTAEGILSGHWYDSDVVVGGHGADVWGHVINGALTDLTRTCKSRMVQIEIIHLWKFAPHADWPACDPSCVEVRVWKGPTVSCAK